MLIIVWRDIKHYKCPVRKFCRRTAGYELSYKLTVLRYDDDSALYYLYFSLEINK